MIIDTHVELKSGENTLAELKDALEFSGVSEVLVLQNEKTNKANRTCVDLAKNSDGLISGVITWAPFADEKKMRIQLNADLRESMIVGYLADLRHTDINTWISDEDVAYGVNLISQHNQPLDLILTNNQIPHLLPFLDAHPDLTIILDSCIGAPLQGDASWKRTMRELGRRPQVYYRLSSLATGIHASSAYELTEHIKPYFDILLTACGAKRILYGSGWPACTSSYPVWLNTVDSLVNKLTDEEKLAIYETNAQAVYDIG